jgi:hypothetical protein
LVVLKPATHTNPQLIDKKQEGLQVDEHDLVTSSLSQEFEKDGHVVKVEIFSSGKNDWILEVVDADGNSTVWDGTFDTDELAFEEFQRSVEEEGINSVIGLHGS